MINIHLCQLFFLRKVWTCFQRKPEHFLQKHVQREDVEFGSRLTFHCEQERMCNGQFASLLRLWKTAAPVSCRLVSVSFLCKCERMWTSVPGVELQHEVPITHWLEFSVGQLGSESSGNTRLVLWEVSVSVSVCVFSAHWCPPRLWLSATKIKQGFST